MFSLLDKIYLELRKDEISKAKAILKRTSIEVIFDTITRCCWKYSIQYEILIKNYEVLQLKLKGSNETVLLKFHKISRVRREDYENFMSLMDLHSVSRGIYLTTGSFDEKITSGLANISEVRRVKLEDSFHFIKGQLGIYERAAGIFKEKRLNFFKYLPA